MTVGYSGTPLVCRLGLKVGMRAAFVDVKIRAGDDDWSGLKLVHRKEDGW